MTTRKLRARKASQWSHNTPPKCWSGGAELWAQTWAYRSADVFAPCMDCTPQYREAMKAQLRCSRPEVVFVKTEDGDIQGVTADDPRYARILLGLKLKDAEAMTPAPEVTKQWVALMDFVAQRADAAVSRAIVIWKKKGEA